MICNSYIIFCIISFFYSFIFAFSVWHSWAANFLITAFADFFTLMSTHNFSYLTLSLVALRTSVLSSWFSSDSTPIRFVIFSAGLQNSICWPLMVGIYVVALDVRSVLYISNTWFLIFSYFSIIHPSCTYILLEMTIIFSQNV